MIKKEWLDCIELQNSPRIKQNVYCSICYLGVQNKLLLKWDLGSGLVIRGIPSWQCTSRGWDWFKNLTYLHFLWVTHSFFYRLVIPLNVGYSSAPGSVGYNFNKASSRSHCHICQRFKLNFAMGLDLVKNWYSGHTLPDFDLSKLTILNSQASE